MVKSILMFLIFAASMPINLFFDDLALRVISAWIMFGSGFLSGIFLAIHTYALNNKRKKEIKGKIDRIHV